MNQRQLDIFIQRYGAKVETFSQRRRGTFANHVYGYGDRFNTYELQHENTVDLELPMESFERLVALDREHDFARADAEIRKRYPAVADAYSKYQMLLALHQS